MSKSREEINAAVIEVLTELTADWELGGLQIGESTALVGELGLSSVDMLTLLSRIDFHTGMRLDYEPLVVREGRFVEDVTVGELVDFVTDRQGTAPPGLAKM